MFWFWNPLRALEQTLSIWRSDITEYFTEKEPSTYRSGQKVKSVSLSLVLIHIYVNQKCITQKTFEQYIYIYIKCIHVLTAVHVCLFQCLCCWMLPFALSSHLKPAPVSSPWMCHSLSQIRHQKLLNSEHWVGKTAPPAGISGNLLSNSKNIIYSAVSQSPDSVIIHLCALLISLWLSTGYDLVGWPEYSTVELLSIKWQLLNFLY